MVSERQFYGDTSDGTAAIVHVYGYGEGRDHQSTCIVTVYDNSDMKKLWLVFLNTSVTHLHYFQRALLELTIFEGVFYGFGDRMTRFLYY